MDLTLLKKSTTDHGHQPPERLSPSLHLDFRLSGEDGEMARMSLAVTKTFSAWNYGHEDQRTTVTHSSTNMQRETIKSELKLNKKPKKCGKRAESLAAKHFPYNLSKCCWQEGDQFTRGNLKFSLKKETVPTELNFFCHFMPELLGRCIYPMRLSSYTFDQLVCK